MNFEMVAVNHPRDCSAASNCNWTTILIGYRFKFSVWFGAFEPNYCRWNCVMRLNCDNWNYIRPNLAVVPTLAVEDDIFKQEVNLST